MQSVANPQKETTDLMQSCLSQLLTSSNISMNTQCFESSSSQNLEYCSESINFFSSPLSLTSTLIIHPFSYGLEFTYIDTNGSETTITLIKRKKTKWWFFVAFICWQRTHSYTHHTQRTQINLQKRYPSSSICINKETFSSFIKMQEIIENKKQRIIADVIQNVTV